MVKIKMINKKKAVSQLIGWVLLIGFTISMAAFITTFSINKIKSLDIEGSSESELYCTDIEMRVSEICRESGTKLKLDLINSGLFSIHKLSIQTESSRQTLSTDFVTLTTPFKPQETRSFPITDLSDGEQIYNLAIIPWVFIEGEDNKINEIACSDKKLTFDSNTTIWLNTLCNKCLGKGNICCSTDFKCSSTVNLPGCSQSEVCCEGTCLPKISDIGVM